ncbi:MAG: FliM/FliN family flagellar motor switch protein [Terriglobales bacterium]
MEKVLSQEQIDAMVRAAQGRDGASSPKTEHRSIEPYTFKQVTQLRADQVRTINLLHEAFASSLAQSLGLYLRVPFEIKLVSAEPLTYFEFLERVPAITYMVPLHVTPMEAAVAMQIDHAIVSPLVDVLLGGTGHCEPMTREVTEIEDQLMEAVARIICHELDKSWAGFGTKFELRRRVPTSEISHFLAPSERILCLSFEVKLAETQGTLSLVLPVAVGAPFLRKLSSDGPSSAGARTTKRSQQKLKDKMSRCAFPVALEVIQIKLPIQSLLGLAPGMLCNLGVPVRKSASLLVAGREVFQGSAVRQGKQRAVRVGEPVPIAVEERPF